MQLVDYKALSTAYQLFTAYLLVNTCIAHCYLLFACAFLLSRIHPPLLTVWRANIRRASNKSPRHSLYLQALIFIAYWVLRTVFICV